MLQKIVSTNITSGYKDPLKNVDVQEASKQKVIARINQIKLRNELKDGCEFMAEKININGVYFGKIIVSANYLLFMSLQSAAAIDEVYKSNDCDFQFGKKTLLLRWCDMEEIMHRACNGPQIGFDIYTCNKK